MLTLSNLTENMRKSGLILAKTIFEPREWNFIGCPPETVPGREGRAVCTFKLGILVHYIVVNHYIKYLLSVSSALRIN